MKGIKNKIFKDAKLISCRILKKWLDGIKNMLYWALGTAKGKMFIGLLWNKECLPTIGKLYIKEHLNEITDKSEELLNYNNFVHAYLYLHFVG